MSVHLNLKRSLLIGTEVVFLRTRGPNKIQQGVSAIHLTPKALQNYSKGKMNWTVGLEVLDHPPPTLLDYWLDTDSELL